MLRLINFIPCRLIRSKGTVEGISCCTNGSERGHMAELEIEHTPTSITKTRFTR